MNEIEACGYLLYPHPRPCAISIRVPRDENADPADIHQTKILSQIEDRGDGQGWKVKRQK